MSAMPDLNDDHFSLIELDDVPSNRRQPIPVLVDPPIELDLTTSKVTAKCLSCQVEGVAVDEHSICHECWELTHQTPPVVEAEPMSEFGAIPEDIAPNTPHYQGAGVEALAADLTAIAAVGAANAATQASAVADGGGRLAFVGFRTQDGYIQAIRNGVKADTHRQYLEVLRNQYKLSGAALAKLNLPGPMAETSLPVGAGITHQPTGPSVFDQPRKQRAFVVGPKPAEVERAPSVSISSRELVAGAAAEGHHAIVAWEGTSGTLRGTLVGALESIGLADWAPKAPNARAQAGSAIARLAKGGLDVAALRKGSSVAGADLAAGEHIWTVGKIGHGAKVGDKFGEIVVRFKLAGSTLTFEGDATLANPVIADYQARMSAELFKSSDVTSWLSRVIRWKLDGVRFGALGWLVPAKHVAQASLLTGAVAQEFGTGWVHGLPVATSDQLRDGIVRGLIEEADDVVKAIATARTDARAAKESALDAAVKLTGQERLEAIERAHKLSGDIGQERAGTYLKELRAIGARVVAYGQVLGEHRVAEAQARIRNAMCELEGLLGEDYSGIRERFALIWEEIEADRAKSGGVL